MKRKPYFLKLLVFSLVLATIPVIVQGFFSYQKASTMIQEKVLDSNKLLLEQSQTHAEQILKSVESTMLNYMNSSEMLKSVHLPAKPQNFPLFRQINRDISSMDFYEHGIKQVYVVNLEQDWVLDGDGVYHLDAAQDKSMYAKLASDMTHPSMWMMDEGYLPNASLGKRSASGNNILLIQKIPLYAANPVGLALVEYPTRALNHLIADSENGTFMILDLKERVIAHSDPSMIGKQLSGGPLPELLRQGQPAGGFETLAVDNQQVGLTYKASSYNGWKYVSLAPLHKITEGSRTIGWISLVIGSSMILFILVLAFLGTRKMYRPIARIYEYAVDSATDGKGDELELIGEQFLKFKSSHSIMRDQLNIQLTQLKDFFLQKLLRGEIHADEARDKLKTFHLPEQWGRMYVFSVQIDSLEHTRFRKKDEDLLRFAIDNIVNELAPAKNKFASVLIDKTQAAIVRFDDEKEEDSKQSVFTLCEEVRRTVKRYLGVNVSIGISPPFAELMEASKAYEAAVEALWYCMKYGEGSILFLQDVQPDDEVEAVSAYPRHVENELVSALKSGEREAVRQKTEELLDWVLALEASQREQQAYFARILTHILKVAQDMRIPARTILEKERSVFKQLFEVRSPEELKRWFQHEIVDEMISSLEDRRESKYVKISDEIMNIVSREFDTDLSLEGCAERLGVHPSFLKRVMKKELGTSFTEYVARYRLQKAKEYLMDTDLKISDIAQCLRFNNSQNFIRYFRRMEGITPGEFRKKSIAQ